MIIGKGIGKELLAPGASGAHMDIVPTVMELISPKGTTYYALGQDVLKGGRPGLHAYAYITSDIVGDLNTGTQEVLPGGQGPLEEKQQAAIHQRLKDEQTIAAWRILHGVDL